MKCLAVLLLALPLLLRGAPPSEVATALGRLREQRSYSWQVINGDPGPVDGQPNTLPSVKGQVDLKGEMLLRREWADGLRLDTFVARDGGMLTLTPEGWLTTQEILTAQAEERLREGGPTGRIVWLRRADRPNVTRPDEELGPLLNSGVKFEETALDTYVARDVASEDSGALAGMQVTITLHLRSGLIRDYEIVIEGTRVVPRSRGVKVPVYSHRIVVLTYMPTAKIDVPAEAREKLGASGRTAR